MGYNRVFCVEKKENFFFPTLLVYLENTDQIQMNNAVIRLLAQFVIFIKWFVIWLGLHFIFICKS